ncbi:hypothetical protein V8F44DRAFT_653420 [Aspergillus fumigatus]
MTVASGSGCPWVDRQCPRCPEYRALRPNVGAQQKHSFVRPGASWATRPAIGRSICAAAYLLAKPSHDATDVIVDLPDPDLAPRGDPHPHRHRDPLGPALDSGKCISVDLGPAASHRDTFSMSISNTDSQVQRNPLRSICPGPACDSGHDPVYPSATGERSDLPGKAVHAMVGMPVQAEETGGPRGQVCGLGGARSGAFCVPTTAPVAGTQHV